MSQPPEEQTTVIAALDRSADWRPSRTNLTRTSDGSSAISSPRIHAPSSTRASRTSYRFNEVLVGSCFSSSGTLVFALLLRPWSCRIPMHANIGKGVLDEPSAHEWAIAHIPTAFSAPDDHSVLFELLQRLLDCRRRR
jgi:hypothetical protein